jgi:uroporphyrinogen decarboxylase
MSVSNRERFKAIAKSQRPGDLSLTMPLGNYFWIETLTSWVQKGAPELLLNSASCGQYFGFDHVRILSEIISGPRFVEYGVGEVGADLYVPPIVPLFETKILGEDEHTLTIINQGGQTTKIFKSHPQKMPMFLDQPVKDWETWKEYKKRLDPANPGRWPADWDGYAARMSRRDTPIGLMVGGFFGFLRDWMGLENLLYAFYDDPELIEDMMDTVLNLELEVIRWTTKDIQVDWAYFYEDMAYKTAPLISPDMVRKFMVPRYRKVADLLHQNCVDILIMESDGNLTKLIPLWLECGINGFSPLEVAAGMDAVALKKEYGNDAILVGNIDKRALLKGQEAIREEVMYKLPFLLEKGGYFPALDHYVPPDITYENYCYYTNTLREVAGLEKLSFQ